VKVISGNLAASKKSGFLRCVSAFGVVGVDAGDADLAGELGGRHVGRVVVDGAGDRAEHAADRADRHVGDGEADGRMGGVDLVRGGVGRGEQGQQGEHVGSLQVGDRLVFRR
jgi:hypothetical protein